MTTQRVGLLLVVVTLVAVGGCFSLAMDEPTDETGLPATGGNTTETTDNESPASSVDPKNPYGERTLVVAIDETNAERNTTPMVREALEYWEQNSEAYAGYPIEYELQPNATDPDVEIVWTESVSVCSLSYDGTYVGCAPYVTDAAPETATVSIETGYLRNHTVDIVKHELGHTLGLAHGDEPAALMNATLNATPREQHVDVQLVLESDDLDREAHREQLRHTLDYYEAWSREHMRTNVTFSLQTNRSTALHTGDLVVRVSEDREFCGPDESASCAETKRGFTDEIYEVKLADVRTDAVGWYAGHYVGAYLYLEAEEIPEVFHEDDYHHVTGDWWDE